MSPHKNELARNHYYHVYNRGLSGGDIFFNTGNYEHCLRLVKRYSPRYGVNILAYCLMPNHYHFLMKQEANIPISKFINVLFNAYVQAVNRQQDRKGTLFEGRVKYVLVDKEEYLIQLCRYIHLNPLKASLVMKLGDWPFSNYREWIGLREGIIFDRKFAEEHFTSQQEYKSFVENYIKENDPSVALKQYVWD
jgi:putative transposase